MILRFCLAFSTRIKASRIIIVRRRWNRLDPRYRCLDASVASKDVLLGFPLFQQKNGCKDKAIYLIKNGLNLLPAHVYIFEKLFLSTYLTVG